MRLGRGVEHPPHYFIATPLRFILRNFIIAFITH